MTLIRSAQIRQGLMRGESMILWISKNIEFNRKTPSDLDFSEYIDSLKQTDQYMQIAY